MKSFWASQITAAIYSNKIVPLFLKYKLLQPTINFEGWHHKNPPQVSPFLATPLVAYCFGRWKYLTEVKSSRTSLVSRTHFEVLGLGLEVQVLGLGLGLEASSPRNLACPRLEDSSIFWIVKILWSAWKIFWKTFFRGDRLKNVCEDLFFGDRRKIFVKTFFFVLEIAWKFFVTTFFFWRALALVSLSLALALSIPVLGLESVCPRKGCPWPWPRIFFVSLALASSLVSSTPPLIFDNRFVPLDWGYEVRSLA